MPALLLRKLHLHIDPGQPDSKLRKYTVNTLIMIQYANNTASFHPLRDVDSRLGKAFERGDATSVRSTTAEQTPLSVCDAGGSVDTGSTEYEVI
jgi:hypothetical protein